MTTYALLEPTQIYNNDLNLQIVKYVEKVNQPFNVAEPFYWIECPDTVESNLTYYDVIKKEFIAIPKPDLPPVTIET